MNDQVMAYSQNVILVSLEKETEIYVVWMTLKDMMISEISYFCKNSVSFYSQETRAVKSRD